MTKRIAQVKPALLPPYNRLHVGITPMGYMNIIQLFMGVFNG